MSLFRYQHRAPHLGKYPMETVKRVDKRTTRIYAENILQVLLRGAFFTRPFFGDLGARAKEERPRFVAKYPLSAAMDEVMQSLIPMQDGDVADEIVPETSDPDEMAQYMKSLVYFMGNGCRVPVHKWWLDHEYRDGKIAMPKETNARDIDPSKANPKKQKIALYAADDLPPGDSKDCSPADRKKALKRVDKAALPENAP